MIQFVEFWGLTLCFMLGMGNQWIPHLIVTLLWWNNVVKAIDGSGSIPETSKPFA
jgi:hypothetical protein